MLKESFPKNDWFFLLEKYFSEKYFKDIDKYLQHEFYRKTIYPPKNKIFNAFELCHFKDTKVVILGQDPYHQKDQAHGLAFSVPKGIRIPPSLRNIYKEIELEFEIKKEHGELTKWAEQGVLLLNSFLTVEESKPMAHSKIGWEIFTDQVLIELNQKEEAVVFLLWGAPAHKKEKLITNSKHLVLKSVHPSPLSAHRGFLGCNHFKLANEFLKKNNLKEIQW